MAHYLLEMSHPANKGDCLNALDMIVSLGMHILHHTWWGCGAGVHTGWLDIEVDSEREARGVIPLPIRNQARVVEVQKFTPNQVKALHQ